MKRIFTALMIAGLLIVAAACGTTPTTPTATADTMLAPTDATSATTQTGEMQIIKPPTSPEGDVTSGLFNIAPPGSKWGDVVGSFQGITIYSNSDTGKPSTTQYSAYGEKWQCVEFVRRFTALRYGVSIPSANAADYWNMTLPGLRRVSNNGFEYPQTGDILVMSGGLGHIVIVGSTANATSIDWAQQNTLYPIQPVKLISVTYLAGTPRYNLPALSGFNTLGWFTRKSQPILVPAIQSIAPSNPRVSTSPQSVALATSGIRDDLTLFLVDPYGNKTTFFKANVSITPGGVVFRPTLSRAGRWSVQIQSGGLLSTAFAFIVS